MKARFASRRFRRRAAWAGALLVVAGGFALLVVLVGNTGHAVPDKFTAGKPALVPPPPKADPFTPAERRQVRAVAAKFVESAVYRNHVDDSWAITTAKLRQGITRAAWSAGEIPIVPYDGTAVAEVRWRLNYSYPNDVALKVAFFPKPNSGVERQVFDIELENHGTAAVPRWMVSYWAPAGGPQLQAASPLANPEPVIGAERGQLAAVWLFAPIGVIVGGLLGVIVFLALRGRVRRARAERLYRSTTSPS